MDSNSKSTQTQLSISVHSEGRDNLIFPIPNVALFFVPEWNSITIFKYINKSYINVITNFGYNKPSSSNLNNISKAIQNSKFII